MNIRFSRLATGLLTVATLVLMSERCWAVFHQLPPSKDEWGLKYDVQLTAVEGNTLNVDFTLLDEGRLKPVYSYTVIAMSKQTDSQGGRSYDVKAPIELKATKDGKRAGQVRIGKEFVDRAVIRILTQRVDGRPQTAGAAYYDIPLKKYLHQTTAAAARKPYPSVATPRAPKVTR